MAMQERQRAMVRLSARLRLRRASRCACSVGCGSGGNLLELLRLGFAPENLVGIELLAERHAAARERLGLPPCG